MSEYVDGVKTATGDNIVSPTITGGTIDNTPIGQTTPAAGIFTTGSFTSDVDISAELSSGIKEIIQASTDTLTAQECRGTIINNYGQSAENTQTLPACEEGLNFLFIIGTAGAGAAHLKAAAGDKHYFDGTALDNGDKVSFATPSVGDCLSVVAFKTGTSSWDWKTQTVSGTATDGGA